jgi:hypothetical protein
VIVGDPADDLPVVRVEHDGGPQKALAVLMTVRSVNHNRSGAGVRNLRRTRSPTSGRRI